MAASIMWKGELKKNLAEFTPKIHARMLALMHYVAPQVEAHAKQHAPWKDQTGNARRGLTATTLHAGDTYTIVLFHRVPYGIYLETRWSGKYQIIIPTIRWGMERVAEGLEAVWRG